MTSPGAHYNPVVIRSALIVLLALPLYSACVQTAPVVAEPTPTIGTDPVTVLLLEPDVELSEVKASGLHEPRADWTEIGIANVQLALERLLNERNATLVRYAKPDDPHALHADDQLFKLSHAVGMTIVRYQYLEASSLPTKAQRFDWTLGPDAQRLGERFDADFALFVALHDSYASAERVAMIIIGAALFGVPFQGGVQVGFASLVDLRSGDIVWFNRLVSSTGDLRTPEPARHALERLLDELPL